MRSLFLYRSIALLATLLWSLALVGQTGPAGVGTNDGSSALKVWLNADRELFADTLRRQASVDGGRVMYWGDLSGSQNHVMARTDSNSPTMATAAPLLNEQRAVRFFQNKTQANRRNYLVSKSFSRTNDITIYCVYHAVTKPMGNNVTPYQAKTFDNNMWYYGAGLVDGGSSGFINDISLALCDTSIAAGAGDSTTQTDYCVKTPASINKTYFAVLQKEAWTGKLSIGHNNGGTASYQAGAQPINNAWQYYIGSTSDVFSGKTSPFFDGYIACVLVYNKLLSKAEKIILENYLSAKYGMPLLQNDFFRFDEPTGGNFDFELLGIGMAADGSAQLSARGEGLLELSHAQELEKGTFLFIAHNGKPLSAVGDDVPEGVQFRLNRKWVFSKNGGASSKVDLLIDPKEVPLFDNQDVVLLIDTDNNGSFADERVGKGMIPLKEVTNQGRFLFQGVNLQDGNQFTFAKFKPACLQDCEAYFSPNGDGIGDTYFLDHNGKTTIYDRSGKLVKAMPTPAYWDGTNEKGELSAPGIYFLVANEDVQKTVTLIR